MTYTKAQTTRVSRYKYIRHRIILFLIAHFNHLLNTYMCLYLIILVIHIQSIISNKFILKKEL
ncbi:hypothetical protein NERG_01371, partial [Nematocida ausubeli]